MNHTSYPLVFFLIAGCCCCCYACEEHHVCLRMHIINTNGRLNVSCFKGKADDMCLKGDVILYHRSKLREKLSDSCFTKDNAKSQGRVYSELGEQLILKVNGDMNYQEADEFLYEFGCAVLHYIPQRSYIIFVPQSLVLDKLKNNPIVSWIGKYKPRYKIAPEWKKFIQQNRTGSIAATILIARGGLVATTGSCEWMHVVDALILRWKRSLQRFIYLKSSTSDAINFTKIGDDSVAVTFPADFTSVMLKWLSMQEWISWIAPVFEAHLGNMFSSAIEQSGASVPLEIGAALEPARPLWSMGIMGDGQVIGIGDSGVDMQSCYFRDKDIAEPGPSHRKVVSYRVMYGGDMIDSYGHGSHVAGSLAGQCEEMFSVESAKYNGMAPHAKIAFTDIGVGSNTYVTPPSDLGDFYRESYELGAKIHTNSWTTGDPSYNIMSRSVDMFAFTNSYFLPVFSAGNAGSSHSSAGTISSPAMSKNSLTVGATLGAASRAPNFHPSIAHASFRVMDPSNYTNIQTFNCKIIDHSFDAIFEDKCDVDLVTTSPTNACGEIQNVESVRGKFVLLSREGCNYADKLVAVQRAGVKAVISFHSQETMLSTIIPGGSISETLGNLLLTVLSRGYQVLVEVKRQTVPGDRFDSMTSFSSWGPTEDGRLKPDLVAPGDRITSARSNMGSKERTCATSVLSGTSMAAPIAAGAAALVRQYFMEGFYPTGSRVLDHAFEPSGALVKALLINGAMPLKGLDGEGRTINSPPSFNQGHGRIDLSNTLVLPGYNSFQLVVKEGESLLTGSGQTYCFSRQLVSGGDITITLVWHDAPASPAASILLVNDLDLIVTTDGDELLGNGGRVPDTLNNVEQIRITDPNTDFYRVDVSGSRVLDLGANGLGQPFALVIRGPVSEIPCLEVRPTSLKSFFNTPSACILLEGTAGASIKWFCSLTSSKRGLHNWKRCDFLGINSSTYKRLKSEYVIENLTDGLYTFSIQARDFRYLNTVSSSISVANFTVDTQAPNTILVSSSECTLCFEATFEFLSDARDLNYFECKLNGTCVMTSTDEFKTLTADWEQCTSPVTYSVPWDGNYTFYVRAVDLAGNVDSYPVSVNWVLHTRPSKAKITGVIPSNSSEALIFFELDFPRKGLPHWSCQLDAFDSEGITLQSLSSEWKSCSSPERVFHLSDGSYVFSVRAVAKEGLHGLSNIPAVVQITIDRTPPDVVLIGTPPAISSSGNVSFTYASSEVAIHSCYIVRKAAEIDKEHWHSCESPTTFTGLQDGNYLFEVKATDMAGNVGAIVSYEFLVDTTAPSVMSLTISQDLMSSITAEFVVDDGATGSGIKNSFCSFKHISTQKSYVPWLPCTSPWKLNRSSLLKGSYVFMVNPTDRAFNVPNIYSAASLLISSDSKANTTLDLLMEEGCPDLYSSQRNATFVFSSLADHIIECECQQDGYSFSCTSPHTVQGLEDGEHIFKVRARSLDFHYFGDWIGCSWTTDTSPPITSATFSDKFDTISPIFRLAAAGSGISHFECMLQKLGSFLEAWNTCNEEVYYGSLPTSLYLFHARSVDYAGNVDQHPVTIIFLVNDWLIKLNKFSSDFNVGGSASYHICPPPSEGPCKFEHSSEGSSIVSSSDGGAILVWPKFNFEVNCDYFLYQSSYVPVSHTSGWYKGKLSSPISTVLRIADNNANSSRQTHFLVMLRKEEGKGEYPLVVLPQVKCVLCVLYSCDETISLTTVWKAVSNDHVVYGDEYVSFKAIELGWYMLIERYGVEDSVTLFVSANTFRMFTSYLNNILLILIMCVCI